jgi:hypothetical protein
VEIVGGEFDNCDARSAAPQASQLRDRKTGPRRRLVVRLLFVDGRRGMIASCSIARDTSRSGESPNALGVPSVPFDFGWEHWA